MNKTTLRSAMLVGLCVSLGGGSVRGDMWENLGVGLGLSGFQLNAVRNPLSGGLDANLFNSFDGTPIDFGAGEIAFAGPISLAVSTGGRLMPTLDVSLSTALNASSTPQTLSYAYTYDPGSQAVNITGNLFIDADFSINRLGFYDMSVTYSSRQTVTRDGRFANDETTNDFDAGPINLSGNIFADILAGVTQPFFDQTGATNPFASFSATSKLNELANAFGAGASDLRIADELGVSVGSAGAGPLNMADLPAGSVVPEPTVLVLLLAGVPVLIRRGRSQA